MICNWYASQPRCSTKWVSCNKSSKRANESIWNLQQTIKYGAFAVCYAIVWCIVFAGLSRKPHTRFQELWSLPRRLALPMKQATSIRSNSSVNCKLLNDKDIHPKQLNRMIYCAYFEPEVFLYIFDRARTSRPLDSWLNSFKSVSFKL